MKKILPHLALALVILLWSNSFVAIKYVLRFLDPLELTVVRHGLALVPLGITLLLAGRRDMRRMTARDWVLVVLLGVLAVPGYSLCLNYSETKIGAGLASMIVALSSTFTYIFGILLKWEKWSVVRILGVPVALAGIGISVFGSLGESTTRIPEARPASGEARSSGARDAAAVVPALDPPSHAESAEGVGSDGLDDPAGARYPAERWGVLVGCLLMLGAALIWAIYNVLGRSLLSRFSPLSMSCLNTAVGTLPMLLFVGRGTVDKVVRFAPSAWAALAFLTLACTYLAVILYFYGLRELGAARTSVSVYFLPPVGVLSGNIILGEPVSACVIVGLLVLVVGVYLTARPDPAKSS
ncbi:MAG: DMT family transporter [Planctomycetota bacterium]|nr:DMT family transporter [Planctomycetota bacterium]